MVFRIKRLLYDEGFTIAGAAATSASTAARRKMTKSQFADGRSGAAPEP